MKRTLINYLGLLGMVSLLSYTAAVIFSPLAYPDYHWLSQAVSDLSAEPHRPEPYGISYLRCICRVESSAAR